jgi:hypothetical protein
MPAQEPFVAQLESFLARYATLERWRAGVEAPAQFTAAYVELVVAWGLSRLGERERAEQLRRSAIEKVNTRDAVHRFLSNAFSARIDMAARGQSLEAPLPLEVTRELPALERFLRYKVDRARSTVTILEPIEPINAVAASQTGEDGLGRELAICRTIDQPQLTFELEQLTKRALASADLPQRMRLLQGVLCFLPRLQPPTAIGLLEQICASAASTNAGVLALALQSAAFFRQPRIVDRVLQEIVFALRSGRIEGEHPLATLSTILHRCLRSLRSGGHRARVRELISCAMDIVAEYEGVGDPVRTMRMVVQTLEAAALAHLGDPDALVEVWWMGEHGEEGATSWHSLSHDHRASIRGQLDTLLRERKIQTQGDFRVLELEAATAQSADLAVQRIAEIESVFDGGLLLNDRMQLTHALAEAVSFAAPECTLATLERLFQRLARISDSYNTNTHLCLSVVSFVDALVRANVERALSLP